MPEDFDTARNQPIEVFFSYSHSDEALRDELDKSLSILKQQGVSVWHDRQIPPGTEWEAALDERINQAHIILLLISSDFLGSHYCYERETTRALERHDKGEAIVLPIILRPCDWKGSRFEKLQALPIDLRPVTKWSNQDEAFTNIAEGIRKSVNRLRSYVKPATNQPGIGDEVFRSCDRDDQVDPFDNFIRREARVLVCGIRATVSDLPNSLANRLTKITLSSYAIRKWGEKEGVVTDKLITWPNAKGVSTGLEFLLSRIYRELDCDERKASAEAFVGAFSTRLEKVIVLRHEIRAERWNSEDRALLEQYLRFWNDVQTRSPAPQFVIFFNLIYPEKPSSFLRWPISRGRFDRGAFSRELQQLFDESKSPNLLLEELPRIEEQHVMAFFARHGILDESDRLDWCEELFRGRRFLPMKEVEQALKKLLNQIP